MAIKKSILNKSAAPALAFLLTLLVLIGALMIVHTEKAYAATVKNADPVLDSGIQIFPNNGSNTHPLSLIKGTEDKTYTLLLPLSTGALSGLYVKFDTSSTIESVELPNQSLQDEKRQNIEGNIVASDQMKKGFFLSSIKLASRKAVGADFQIKIGEGVYTIQVRRYMDPNISIGFDNESPKQVAKDANEPKWQCNLDVAAKTLKIKPTIGGGVDTFFSIKIGEIKLENVSASRGEEHTLSLSDLSFKTGVATIPIAVIPKAEQNKDGYIIETQYKLEVKLKFNDISFAQNLAGENLYKLSPEFSENQTNYTLTLPEEGTDLYIRTVSKDNAAMRAQYGETTVSLENNYHYVKLDNCISESEQSKSLRISIGETSYTVKVERKPSLSNITVKSDNINISLDKDFRKEEQQYYAFVPEEATALTISCNAKEGYAVTVNEKAAENGVASCQVDWNKPDIPIKVTSGSQETVYQLTLVKRKGDHPVILSTENFGKDAKRTEKKSVISSKQAAPLIVHAVAPAGGTISYEWQYDTYNNGKDYTKISINNTLNLGDFARGYTAGETKYRCKITNTAADGKTYEIYTPICTVFVDAEAASQPQFVEKEWPAQKVMKGATATTINAATSSGELGETCTYQWYVNTTGSTTGGTEIQGATEPVFTPPTETAGVKYYYCIATRSIQKYTNTNTTSAVRIEVVDASGSLSDQGISGTGTQTDPFKLEKEADFAAVRERVKDGITFSGSYFKMVKDISLSADWEPIGTLKEGETATGANGSDTNYAGINILPFSGELDGGNFTLTYATGGKPLFGYVREASVKNLKIKGEQIDSYGLVNNYAVDYGTDGNYNTGVPDTIKIDNVTLLSGSSTLKSGLIGGFASGRNTVEILNSTIEDHVTIGYGKNESEIGSFAGEFNGRIANCKSEADVYGVDAVGGFIGYKGQSMGTCSVTNSRFTGTVTASGSRVGGMIGSGYSATSAPNTPVVSIQNCYVTGTISGANQVGGILGAEPICQDCWSNGQGVISDNLFYGTIKSSGSQVGGIIGFLKSFNKYQGVENNYYLNTCGASKGLGEVEHVIYTTDEKYGGDGIAVGSFHPEALCIVKDAKAFKDGTVKDALNNSKTSLKNWVQGDLHPVFSDSSVIYRMSVAAKSGTLKETYYIGESLDKDNLKITAYLTDGSSKELSVNEVEITGFESKTIGEKTITIKYGSVATSFDIKVLNKDAKEITVYFTLWGDKRHDSDKDGEVHTLSGNNLQQWIPKTAYKVTTNSNVKDVFERALTEHNMTWRNPGGNYVEAIYHNGVELAEKQNGANSGWMYTLNESHPELGLREQYLKDGDRIVWHYTDDYTKEEGTDKWGAPDDNQNGEETKPVTNDVSSTVKDGQAASVVSDQSLTALIDQAIKEKANQIQINVTGADKADQVSVAFTKDSVAQVADKAGASLQITTPAGIVTMDAKAIRAIVKAASGKDLILALEKQAVRLLSAKKASVKSASASKSAVAEKKELGANALQARVYLLSGDKEITDWGSSATIRVALPVSSALKDKELSAVLLGADDSLTKIGGKQTTIDQKSYYQVELSKAETIILDEEANIDDVITSQGKKGKPIVQDLTVEIKDGKGTVALNEEDVNSLLEAATKYSAPSINLNLTETSGADALCLQVPKTALAGIASKAGVSLQMTTPQGIMLLDKESLKAIVKAAAGREILFTVERQNLTADNKKALGSSALQTKFTIGSGGKEVTDLGTAKAVLLLPLSDGLQGKTLAAATADGKGNLTKVTGKVIELDGESWYQIETTKAGVFLLAEKAKLEAAIKAQNSTDPTAAFAKAKPVVKLTNISKTKIKASWKPIKGAGGYAVYRADKSKGKYVRIKVIKTAKTCAFTDSRLKAGKTYYYKVCAFKKAGTKILYSAYSKACKVKATL